MAAPTNFRRLFEESATLEYLLLGDFRAVVEEIDDESSHRWLVAVMRELLTALPRKLEAMRSAGTIRTRPPRKAGAAPPPSANGEMESLCVEQGRLLDALQELLTQVCEVDAFHRTRQEVAPKLIAWMEQTGEHNRRAAVILQPLFDAADKRA